MSRFVDARVPVSFGPAALAGPEARVVVPPVTEGPVGEGGHVPGCACCLPRGALAAALGRLFIARARGEVAFFRAVLVATDAPGAALDAAAVAALTAELAGDPLISGRFRVAAPGGPP